jgi:hypothetical protein
VIRAAGHVRDGAALDTSIGWAGLDVGRRFSRLVNERSERAAEIGNDERLREERGELRAARFKPASEL